MSKKSDSSTHKKRLEDFQPYIDDIAQRFPNASPELPLIIIVIKQQRLYFIHNLHIYDYPISSASAGTGNHSGSLQTPLGLHRIAEKIGDGAAIGTRFKARQNTGEVASILLDPQARSNADNITSRILWLDGMERDINKGGEFDSHDRFIYIHGTDEEGRLGQPASHGCIRMSNADIIELFEHTPLDTNVLIIERLPA